MLKVQRRTFLVDGAPLVQASLCQRPGDLGERGVQVFEPVLVVGCGGDLGVFVGDGPPVGGDDVGVEPVAAAGVDDWFEAAAVVAGSGDGADDAAQVRQVGGQALAGPGDGRVGVDRFEDVGDGGAVAVHDEVDHEFGGGGAQPGCRFSCLVENGGGAEHSEADGRLVAVFGAARRPGGRSWCGGSRGRGRGLVGCGVVAVGFAQYCEGLCGGGGVQDCEAVCGGVGGAVGGDFEGGAAGPFADDDGADADGFAEGDGGGKACVPARVGGSGDEQQLRQRFGVGVGVVQVGGFGGLGVGDDPRPADDLFFEVGDGFADGFGDVQAPDGGHQLRAWA
ncbi:hypothetical protein ACFQY4_18085 [Catellatospora bangladeshensis]|uniref:hypothetical protein n=1 Tax=Catellatospora bangladeshensis TaxID=310355 RepID=UPI0036081918